MRKVGNLCLYHLEGKGQMENCQQSFIYIKKKNAHMDRNEITGIKSRGIKFKLGWNICHDLLRVAM